MLLVVSCYALQREEWFTIMSMTKVYALFAKDMKMISYNLFVISGLLVVPVVAFFFTLTADAPEPAIADLLLQMNILINGANIICVIIAEEKEKHTLSVLIASTVSGVEFLAGKLLVTTLLTLASNVVLFLITGLGSIMPIGPFILVTGAAILPAAAIGAIIGIACKTQASASSAVAPLMMLLVLLPMFLPQGFFTENILYYVFSQQMSLGLAAVYHGTSFLPNIGIIAVNFVVLSAIFWGVYKKKGLSG